MAKNTYGGSINLMKLQGAFLRTMAGKTATKQCVCIPIEDAMLHSTENGIFLDIIVFENDDDKIRYDQTHSIKQSFSKEQREKLGDTLTPYLGNLRIIKKTDMASQAAAEEAKHGQIPVEDDLPF